MTQPPPWYQTRIGCGPLVRAVHPHRDAGDRAVLDACHWLGLALDGREQLHHLAGFVGADLVESGPADRFELVEHRLDGWIERHGFPLVRETS